MSLARNANLLANYGYWISLNEKKTVRCQKVNTQLLALGKFMTNSETDRIA